MKKTRLKLNGLASELFTDMYLYSNKNNIEILEMMEYHIAGKNSKPNTKSFSNVKKHFGLLTQEINQFKK